MIDSDEDNDEGSSGKEEGNEDGEDEGHDSDEDEPIQNNYVKLEADRLAEGHKKVCRLLSTHFLSAAYL